MDEKEGLRLEEQEEGTMLSKTSQNDLCSHE